MYDIGLTGIENHPEVLCQSHDLASYKRGNSYAGLGEYQRAIQDYDKTIELDHQFAKASSIVV